VSEWEASCPFCPGNEHTLPAIVSECPGQGEHPWQTRVVLNKYPALNVQGAVTRSLHGIYVAMEGYGHHEVIVEHPRHNSDIATMRPEEVDSVIATYHQRYMELRENPQNALILVFRNHGVRAGASLHHPHSQIITTNIFPRRIRWRNEEAQRYFDEWGRCIYCDILAFEATHSQRVILESEAFLAFIPFAAEVPFETWIVPKRHQADFGQISATEQKDLAVVLQTILKRLAVKLQDPDYNYMINSSVHHEHGRHLHWHLTIRPRLVTRAGFEIGTGMRINPSLPEADAAFLSLEGLD
jgi:UDPglucose--hexose-1-phosphate uridylyltransferase